MFGSRSASPRCHSDRAPTRQAPHAPRHRPVAHHRLSRHGPGPGCSRWACRLLPHEPAGAAAARPGRQTRKAQLVPRDLPRAPADDHGQTASNASTRRPKRADAAPTVANLSGLRALICSAEAVATADCAIAHIAARQSVVTAAGAGLLLVPVNRNHLATQHPGEANPQLNGLNRAPLRNRTVDLLLTIYLRVHAVANCDDAGQVRGSALCCSPTYMVITAARLGGDPLRPTTEGKRACKRIVPT
jgi:hypothetical protein